VWRLSSTARPSPALPAPFSHQNGAYLADCGLGKPAPSATDDALSDALWAASATLTGVGGDRAKKQR
jgi:hypothetical protein